MTWTSDGYPDEPYLAMRLEKPAVRKWVPDPYVA